MKRSSAKQTRAIDPKRKAWYEKRLQEQAQKVQPTTAAPAQPAAPPIAPAKTKAAAVALGANLLETLAAAKDAKAKEQKTKTEPWRRKPGDPIF